MFAILALSPGPVRCAERNSEVRLEVLARGVVPGEVLRIRAHFDEPVVSVEGSFLDRELTFLRDGVGPGAEDGAKDWSAWAVVDLGQRPVGTTIDIRARTGTDRSLHGAKSVQIRGKKFPTQRLTVDSKFVSPPPEVLERITREREEMAEIYAARSEGSVPARAFVRPVPGPATSTFGARRILNGELRDPHPGLDLKASEGTPVLAAGPGRIVVARDLYYSGGTVVLDHGGGLFTIYAHLSRIDAPVGANVQAGATLGLSGSSGRVTGPHLHWGAKIGDRPFDPTALLDPRLFR